jgi:hypothetical protein
MSSKTKAEAPEQTPKSSSPVQREESGQEQKKAGGRTSADMTMAAGAADGTGMPAGGRVGLMRQLQRQVDGRRVSRALRRSPIAASIQRQKCACGGEAGAGGECAECKARRLQAKMTVGAPGDAYEQEADAVSKQVVQKIQRAEAPVQDQSTRPQLQMQADVPGEATDAQVTPDIEQRITNSAGQGQPMRKETRAQMEGAMGADFSGVRLHTDANADHLNRSLNARAFTTGQDIYFKQGEYNPDSHEGQRLLAHELTHTVQQSEIQKSLEIVKSSEMYDYNVSSLKRSRWLRRMDAAHLISDSTRWGILQRFHAVWRMATRQDARQLRCSPASDVIYTHTSWGNLNEGKLGEVLVQRAQQGNFEFVVQVLNTLGSTDRDDVSYEFAKRAPNTTLEQFAQSEGGRRMLDRLFDELTAGSVADEEQNEANRILRIKQRQASTANAPQSLEEMKHFPFRLPGLTVLHDAPLSAERRGEGKIWVKYPVRVLGTDMFRNETKTLPTETFIGGIELPENELVAVRMYDLGKELHVRPALYLVQLANQTDTKILETMAETAGIGLTLGSGALVGVPETMVARVLLCGDRIAFVAGTLTVILREHRSQIIEMFPNAGPPFMDAVDVIHQLVAIYGGFRAVYEFGGFINGLRKSYKNWRTATEAQEGLDASKKKIIEQLNQQTDKILENAEEIKNAKLNNAPSRTTDAPSAPGATRGTSGNAPEPVVPPKSPGVSSPLLGPPEHFPFGSGSQPLPKPQKPNVIYRIVDNQEAAASLQSGRIQTGVGGKQPNKYFALESDYAILHRQKMLTQARELQSKATSAAREGNHQLAERLRNQAQQLLADWHAAPGQTVILEIQLKPGALEDILRNSIDEKFYKAYQGLNVYIYKLENGMNNIAIPSWNLDRFNKMIEAVRMGGWRAPFGSSGLGGGGKIIPPGVN